MLFHFSILCDDPDADVLVWSEAFYIGRGIMMNKPTVLSSGEWLFPIAIWPSEIHGKLRAAGLREDDDPRSYVYKSSDNGKTFVKLGGSAVKERRCDEHMVLELPNGVLAMYVRTRYGIAVSHSYDRGVTWSHGEDSGLGGPCSRFYIGRLRSGRILLINHINFTGRNNLTALLSEDDGKTFPYSIMLDERSGVSYPDVCEGEDGYLYIIYDRERGHGKRTLEEAYTAAREILVAKITENDIINGGLKDQNSYLKRIVSKLGALSDKDENPYLKKELTSEELAEKLLSEGGNIAEKVFALFPFNCTSIYDIDSKKVEALVRKFEDNGSHDKELLVQIITIIRTAPKQCANANPIIDAIKKYIEEHISEDFLVSDLADSLKISVYYLCHMFKAVTGITEADIMAGKLVTSTSKLRVLINDNQAKQTEKTADTPSAAGVELKMTVGKTEYTVNGEVKMMDVAPIIVSSRTMLPVRYVAEALGATVVWDGDTSTATITTAGTALKITVGASEAVVNGQAVRLDSPAFIENSRTYMPVRFVAETLGATVAWDGATSTATITK